MSADTFCPVCGRRDSWGCGHTGSQRSAARRHNATKRHRSGACEHYDHADCDPADCRLAGNVDRDGNRIHPPGYVPMLSHRAKATRHERMA